MLRITLLSLFVSFFAVYAWKDWFRSLCALIILMAVIEHPDMPKAMMGVPGLNVWNILLISVCLAWLKDKRLEQLHWDAPKHIQRLLILYFLVVVFGFFRLLYDDARIADFAELRGGTSYSTLQYTNEYLLNTVKFTIPGLLLFSGCRTRSRLMFATATVIALYFVIALIVIKQVKLGSLLMPGDALQARAHKVLPSNVGYHRVNLSMMLSGFAWALYSYREFFSSVFARTFLLLACAISTVAMMLTGGRMGYVTWCILALILAITRWRKLLLAAPAIVVIILVYLPSVVERLSVGFIDDGTSNPAYATDLFTKEGVNLYDVTSGRVLAWPLVVDKIMEAPVIGYGREAMRNTGISTEMYLDYGSSDSFGHPHNAYLQWLLDNGLMGFIVIIIFYAYIFKYSYSLFKDSRSPLFVGIGGICLSLVGALFIASFGSQTFYPREGAVGMWCAMGLMLRVYIERAKWDSDQTATGTDRHLDEFMSSSSSSAYHGEFSDSARTKRGLPHTTA
jgi:O-antigen ligase